MEHIKRERSANFSAAEEDFLMKLVAKRKDVLLSKKTDLATNKAKETAWMLIAKEFNLNSINVDSLFRGTIYRNATSLRRKYKNLNQKRKLEVRSAKGSPITIKIEDSDESNDAEIEEFNISEGTKDGINDTEFEFAVLSEIESDSGFSDPLTVGQEQCSQQELIPIIETTTSVENLEIEEQKFNDNHLEIPQIPTSTSTAETTTTTTTAKKTIEDIWGAVGRAKLELVNLQMNQLKEEHELKMQYLKEEYKLKLKKMEYEVLLKRKEYTNY